ncbi:coiled-coil domain-containing protein 152-like isoform X2 [Xyrichtys novacula]|uniref:Coiled-coil domain-containing protein 152-like isoform X2 n=1 Tax=Xyrichtys novacula TaxID=13765 RepID=A0AAV1GF70_XYRNO|nr:coiled-coil domain-containing protein 152-like isoform X2 [Xyrichtys novacula]
MAKSNGVNLDKLLQVFNQLEMGITGINSRNNCLETTLEDATRQLKFCKSKEKSLTEERDCLLATVNSLQQTLQEHMNLRVKNDELTRENMDLKQQNEQTMKDGEAEVQRLVREMRADAEKHQMELEAVRQQCKREVEDVRREAFDETEAKVSEVKSLLVQKDVDLEEIKKKLKEQEKEKQSELLKLQMEKLQFLQEEKNREIEALRQRIKELEVNQRVCPMHSSPSVGTDEENMTFLFCSQGSDSLKGLCQNQPDRSM